MLDLNQIIGFVIAYLLFGLAIYITEKQAAKKRRITTETRIEKTMVLDEDAMRKNTTRQKRLDGDFLVVNDTEPITTQVSNRYSDNDRSHRPGSRGL